MSIVETVQVLLVEDQPTDAHLIFRALEAFNLRTSTVWLRDGALALNYLLDHDASGKPPDLRHLQLVLLDVKLPKVDGIEVLRQLRRSISTRFVPIVMLTSSQERRDIANSYLAGANSYIVKPVDFDEFIKTMSSVLAYWMRLNLTPEAHAAPPHQGRE